MSFFGKARSGPKVGGDCKKGGGIKGAIDNGYITNVSYKIPGAGEQEGYDQVVTKEIRSKQIILTNQQTNG